MVWEREDVGVVRELFRYLEGRYVGEGIVYFVCFGGYSWGEVE